MDQLKVAQFIESNNDYFFPNNEYTDLEIENALITAPDDFELHLNAIPFRKPSTLQIISVFPGSLGIDRFYLGDIKNGILKYFTFGGFGIWWLKDIFSAKERCRRYNCKKLLDALSDPSVAGKMQNIDNTISNTVNTAKAFAPVAKTLVKGLKDVGKTFDIDN